MAVEIFVDRQSPEYLKALEQRELKKIFKEDYDDVQWVERVLMRLEKASRFLDFTAEDSVDFWKARGIVDRVMLKAGFDPGQPRAPRGISDGGQWTEGAGGSSWRQ